MLWKIDVAYKKTSPSQINECDNQTKYTHLFDIQTLFAFIRLHAYQCLYTVCSAIKIKETNNKGASNTATSSVNVVFTTLPLLITLLLPLFLLILALLSL